MTHTMKHPDDDDTTIKTLSHIIALIVVIPSSIVIMAVRGYVIAMLWLWFVVDTFDVPALSLWQACGIALIFETFDGYQVPQDSDDATPVKTIVMTIAYYLIIIGVGWIIHSF